MIRLCNCKVSSASSIENQPASASCRSCGGKLINGLQALSGSMLSTMGLELSGVVDPHLNWSTATKGRQRARRARTSLTSGYKRKFMQKSSTGNDSSTGNEDAIDKGIDGTGDLIVSDSEKVGVTILGQRFSDSLQSVPIKKRRFLRMRSPSPPPESSCLDDSDYFLESHATHDYKHQEEEISPYKRSNPKFLKDEACDAADFSGISILAAAACNSDIVGDIINAGGISKGNSSNEVFSGNVQSHESCSISKDLEHQLQTSDDLQEKCHVPSLMSSTSILSADESKFVRSKVKVGSPGQQVCCDRTQSSSRDSRLHWDLNIVMDAWDSSSSEVMNSEILPTDHAKDVVHNGKQVLVETCEVHLQSECFKAPGQHPAEVVLKHGYEALKTEERNMSIVNSVDAKEPEESCSQRAIGFQELELQVDVASASSVNSIDEIKVVHDEYSNVCHTIAVSGDEPALSLLNCLSAIDSDYKNTSISLGDKEAETSPHLPSGKMLRCDNTCHEVLIPREHTNSHAGNFKSSPSDFTQPEPVSIGNSVIKKHENLHSVSEHGDLFPLTTNTTERAPESKDGNILKKLVTMNNPCDRTLNSNDSDIVKVYGADKSCTEDGIDPCSESKHCHENVLLSKEKELSSQVPCAGEIEMSKAEMEVADGKHAVPSDVSFVLTETDCSDNNSLDTSVLTSLGKQVEVDAGLEGKIFLNDTRTVFNDKYDSGHTSNASGDIPVLINGMEKVDLLEDDDSQYEDGEFRESILHSWGDGAEEVETEQVDYDSDNQENELLEAVSCVPSAVPIDSLTCKDSLNAGNDVLHAGMDAHLSSTTQPLFKCSSTSEALDTESFKRVAGNVVRNGQIDCLGFVDECRRQQIDNNDVSRSNAYCDNMSRFKDDDLDNGTSARIKTSGWDRLPERDMSSGVGLDSGASVKKNHAAGFLERSGSSFRRDLSSRIERFNSDDIHRKERNYSKAIRYDARHGAGTKSDRFNGSSGRDGPSQQGRIRGKNWFDSPNHSGPRHNDSPSFFGASSFEQTGTRNAAAAAVAKVESNGFVVAPDGTLVKASGAGPASRSNRSSNGPPQSSHCTLSDRRPSCERERTCGMQRGLAHPRDITPERHFDMNRGRTGRYSQEMVRWRYHRPLPDDRAELAVHQLSRSERSLYHRRGPLRNSRSRTRSTSRSITRSPRPWTPPRGSGVGINGGPALLRHSRSPNFRSNAKMRRAATPHRRPSFDYHISGYGPTSRRTQVSSGASRWADERKVSPEQLREHEYKRRSGRSADLRMLRNHRFDSIDSNGRPKPVENYRPFHSGWVAEIGFGRSSRHNEDDDRRGHGGRYGVPHGMRQYDVDNNEKPTHYDLDEDFQAHKSSPTSTGFRRSLSPRAFDRGIHGQIGDSPPGAKEKTHFRYDK